MRSITMAVALLLGTVPVTVQAYIPPNDVKELGWDGPGNLCERDFTLEVDANEFVREDIQLEPWYPVSNTVKSARGWYSITVLKDKPKRSQRIALIASDKTRRIYAYKPTDPASFSARYIFISNAKDRPPIEVKFFRADKPDALYTDWRVIPQKSYDSASLSDVLKRIKPDFKANSGCINHSN